MVIANGTVFTEGRFVQADIRIRNGRIAEIGHPLPEAGEETVDARGCYVLPGFVDLHIHAFAGADCMRGEADVRSMARSLHDAGVAAFMPTTMSASIPETRAALEGIQAVLDAPRAGEAAVLGAHMEAPFLSAAFKGAQLADCLMEPSMEAYERMTDGLDCVRMMTIAPELPGAYALIARLKERGVVTCAAHSGASARQVHEAADAGMTQITHLFNAQSPLHHREPGVPGAGLADDRLIVQVIADGIHLHPDILRIAGLCKGAKGVALITDAMEAAGLPDGQYDLGGQTVYVRDGAARLASGALAGSTLYMHRAVRNMIRLAGLPPESVIPMATSTPADAVGAKDFGRIAVGQRGMLLMMNGDWELERVIDA